MKRDLLGRICSYVALAISIVLISLWCVNVGGFHVVNLETFVAVIIALLAIIVTIVLGWQIYNTIELKEKMKELDIIKKQLNGQEKNLNQLTHKTRHMIGLTLGEKSRKRILHKFLLLFGFCIKKRIIIRESCEC